MSTQRIRIRSVATAAAAVLLMSACSEAEPLAVAAQAGSLDAARAAPARYHSALAQIRRATGRYHDVEVAMAEGYVAVGGCEAEEGEAPGGIPYANLEYLLDGMADPSRPDALLYEADDDGDLTLVAAELAIPIPMWTASEPPEFFGNVFRAEEEMGVWGLHIWLWRHNPDGLFAWGNPRVRCGEGS